MMHDYDIGDKVEVCSEEEGFEGSYFEATVVACIENGEYAVRYTNLLSDDESAPLIEIVKANEVRPLPPCVNPQDFNFYQKVDAFDNDGWWIGLIISEKIATQNGYYYGVYFQNTNETIHFRFDQIRVHHEWVDGEWILEESMRPPMKKVDYKEGDKVEVCSKEEGFIGSYYEGTIVSCLENGKYVVCYKNLIEDDNSGRYLKETLYPKELRPLPPRVRNPTNFKRNQKVDAFDNDGWWLGVIASEKMVQQKIDYYKVYFPNCNESIYYPSHRIRLHHQWFAGHWIK
uniref:DUF724 domain-containing protein 2-like n=1 Tax=Cicer arietinum TaxID=3827 RepID=A0A3Q7YC21_CICAR|nr:DUF724 domain-containing protein 2-like [Cicer arietinum]